MKKGRTTIFNHISSKGLDPSHQKDQQSPDARRVNLLLIQRLLQQPQDQLHPGTADPSGSDWTLDNTQLHLNISQPLDDSAQGSGSCV